MAYASGGPTQVNIASKKPRILLAASGSVTTLKYGHVCSCCEDWADVKAVATQAALHLLDTSMIPEDVTLCTDEHEWSSWSKGERVGSARLKRKRAKESLALSEMLDWVQDAAKDPHDVALGTSKRSSTSKNSMGDKLRKQALLARKALFAEMKIDLGNDASGSQKKNQRMHPSMYESDKGTSRTKKCCKKSNSEKPCSCPKCILPSSSRSRMKHQKTASNEGYNLGPDFQAQVPAWTGPVYDSDPKWLGTQIWSPLDQNTEEGILVISTKPQISCKCVFRGSAECMRFHVAENRLKVKLELGSFFYKWKFNQMGEEASLSWEPEEEKRFKSLVFKARHDLVNSPMLRQEIMNKFWRKAMAIIPAKPKFKLISYYFNVYVLRRRSYQNRVTPKEIDSDNDEDEVGSVGDRFGYEKIHGSLPTCSENKQCKIVDLDGLLPKCSENKQCKNVDLDS